jgi:hypothetical protein
MIERFTASKECLERSINPVQRVTHDVARHPLESLVLPQLSQLVLLIAICDWFSLEPPRIPPFRQSRVVSLAVVENNMREHRGLRGVGM